MPHVLAQDLRNAVLQAAIQGKLTNHLSTDGSVEQLLSKIEFEKKQLIKEKRLKKEKPLPPISKEEIPFDIPEYWTFVRTGNVIDCGSGSTPLKGHPEYYENGTIPWLKTGELNNSYIEKCEDTITEIAYKVGSFRMNQPGDILIAMYGATIGKLGICTFPLTTNQACLGCTPLGDISNRFLFYYFMASKDSLTDKAEGGAQPNISRIKIRNHLMPLPPIEEQARIVARVDELMAKIDEYEKIEKELVALHKAFPGNMKDAILQAAFEGKLTDREKLDSSVLEALKYHSFTRKKKIAEKEIKNDTVLPIDEVPFEVPDEWEWVRLNEIFSVLNGDRGKNYPAKNTLKKTGTIPFISALNLNGKDVTVDDNLLYLSEEQYGKLKAGKLKSNDTVMCIRGSLGKHGKFQFEKGAIASSLVIIRRISELCDDRYLFYYLDSPLLSAEIRKYDNGTAQPNLAAESLKQFLFPLPSIEEQQRIVDKLDRLLPLCESLEAMV